MSFGMRMVPPERDGRCAGSGESVSAGLPDLRSVIPRLRRLCIHRQSGSRMQASIAGQHVSAHLLIDRGL